MGKLTLEDAISHAKEVAEKTYRGAKFESIDSVDDDIKANCIKCAKEHEQLAKWLKELKSYKDSEEQGLLVRLPCKVGEDVYKVNSYVGCDNDKCDDLYSSVHCFNCKFEKEFYYIQKIKFNFDNLDDVGRTIFITKEEAEKKLEEMK